jgi:hypothetical protein
MGCQQGKQESIDDHEEQSLEGNGFARRELAARTPPAQGYKSPIWST